MTRLLLCAACLFLPGSAWAQSSVARGGEIQERLDTVAQAGEGEQPVEDAGRKDAEPPAKTKSRDLIIVPIPHSSPSLGAGITLGAGLFYNPNKSREPWITGLGAMYTSNHSRAVGAAHKMTLARDKFRVAVFGGYADVNVNFYGVGPNAGDRDLSIELNEKGYAAMVQGQMRLMPNVFVGARFEYLDLDSSVNIAEPLFPDLELPRPEFESRLSELGLVASYDRRDSSLNPRSGEVVTAAWMFSLPDLGSDFDHDKFLLSGNLYRPLDRDTVLAARVSLCGVSKGGPFYDLCMYGSSSDLRGYEAGRYRDGGYWAAQVELRQHLFGRFGAVAFAGVGESMGSLTDFGKGKFLPAGGVGVRFQPSKDTPINLRVDYAIGKDSHALYVSVGEAF